MKQVCVAIVLLALVASSVAIPLSLQASLGRVCRKLGSDVNNPTYDDCIRCVEVETAAAQQDRATNGVALDRPCVFISINNVGNCRNSDRDERTRAQSGAAENPTQCSEDYLAAITAAVGDAALGFEFEFVGAELYWGKSRTSLTKIGQDDNQIIAHTPANIKLGPNNNIHALSVTVDMGATTELISGPIPLNHKTYVEEFIQAMHAWSAASWELLKHSNCRQDTDGSFGANGPNGAFRGRNVQDVIDRYHAKIAGTGAEKFQLQYAVPVASPNSPPFAAALLVETRRHRVFKCLPDDSAQSRVDVSKGHPQINFGMKIKALGLVGNEFVRTMSPHLNAGPKLYTNIQSRLDAWLDAQPTLQALKDNVYLRAVFQAIFYVASTESFHSNFKGNEQNRGFQSKNVANSMLKGSVQDMIRAIPHDNVRAAILAYKNTNPTAGPIADFFCVNGDCDNADSLLHGITHLNERYFHILQQTGGVPAAKTAFKAAFQAKIGQAVGTVFDFNHDRYGAVEQGVGAVYAHQTNGDKPPSGHDKNWSVKPDACYGLFDIGGDPAMVVEARIPTQNDFINAYAVDLTPAFNKDTFRASAVNGKAILDALNA